MDNKRTCSCGCGAELRSRWPYLKGHNKVDGGATVAAPKKPRKTKCSDALPIGTVVQFGQGVSPEDVAKVLEESDPFIVVRLRQSHIGRLLGLLLQ